MLMEMERVKGDLWKENLKEDVLKLTTLQGNIRGWMLHLSTVPACCHGDRLLGQQAAAFYFVCIYVCVKKSL